VRLPHVWTADGKALHDQLGQGFTLVKLGTGDADTGPLEQALREIGASIEVIAIDNPAIRDVYARDLILIRPDLHVAWRGNIPPENPRALARLVTGWE